MARYAAFLRGVMPAKPSMADLKTCFEEAGFQDVKTLLGSGNVLFTARAATDAAIERRIEAAMEKHLGKVYAPCVRSVEELTKLVEADPFAELDVKAGAKRVVTFFRDPPGAAPDPPKLPVTLGVAHILALREREAFTAYERDPAGPVFMKLIQKTFGKDVTTRTWETVIKAAKG